MSGVSIFWVFVLLYKTSPSAAALTQLSDVEKPIEVMMIFAKASNNAVLRDKFRICIISIMKFASKPINLHIAGDTESQQIAQNIIEELEHKPKIILENMDKLAHGVTDLLGDVIGYFRHSAGAYYGDNLFFVSIVLHLLMKDIPRIIMLDSDLRFRTDIMHLWNQFDNFNHSNLIGIAREQQPVYSVYRSKNSKTLVGEPPPSGITGFNSGVLLLDLEKMRSSKLYSSLLRIDSLEKLVHKYSFKGHLGDQDLYTLLSIEYMQLFYVLDCGWNRQLCVWWKDKGYEDVFDKYWNCSDVFVYHGNCNTAIPRG